MFIETPFVTQATTPAGFYKHLIPLTSDSHKTKFL